MGNRKWLMLFVAGMGILTLAAVGCKQQAKEHGGKEHGGTSTSTTAPGTQEHGGKEHAGGTAAPGN